MTSVFFNVFSLPTEAREQNEVMDIFEAADSRIRIQDRNVFLAISLVENVSSVSFEAPDAWSEIFRKCSHRNRHRCMPHQGWVYIEQDSCFTPISTPFEPGAVNPDQSMQSP